MLTRVTDLFKEIIGGDIEKFVEQLKQYLTNNMRFIIIAVVIYLSLGFVFAAYVYYQDLRTFKCDDPNIAHGYITTGTGLFKNPDPERCVRRGFELNSIATIPLFTAIGVPILITRSIGLGN